MSTRTAADGASAAQAKKLEDMHARLTDQIAGVTSGADWKAWLKVAAWFHTYSTGNTMLDPRPTPGCDPGRRTVVVEAWGVEPRAWRWG